MNYTLSHIGQHRTVRRFIHQLCVGLLPGGYYVYVIDHNTIQDTGLASLEYNYDTNDYSPTPIKYPYIPLQVHILLL